LIEILLLRLHLVTLESALSMVLVVVALSSLTYVATTLVAAMRTEMRAGARARKIEQGAALVGVTLATAVLTLGLAIVRVGDAGSGGELVPTLSMSVALAATFGSVGACVLFALGRSLASRQAAPMPAPKLEQAGAAPRSGFAAPMLELNEVDAESELVHANASLERLQRALIALSQARESLMEKMASLSVEPSEAGDDSALACAYRRAIDEATMKVELGASVQAAAEAAVYRVACGTLLRKLIRKRPKEALSALGRHEEGSSEALTSLEQAEGALRAFLGAIDEARAELERLAEKRPACVVPNSDEDPWLLTWQDLRALESAYRSLHGRVEMLVLRRVAEASLEEVADAASALEARVPPRGGSSDEFSELAIELTRAETAVIMATPVEADPRAVTAALSRSMGALGRSDEATLDDLLTALRSIV